MANHDGEDTYIIPHNYTDNGKIFGIIEVRSLYLAAIWFIPTTYLNFWLVPFTLTIKLVLFMIVIVPPTAIALVGVGSENLQDFLIFVYKYYKNRKEYLYEK